VEIVLCCCKLVIQNTHAHTPVVMYNKTHCRPTWRRTANSLLSPDVANCVRQTSTRVKFGGPTHDSVIARLPLRGHEHGTVCQSTCETLNYHSSNSGGHLRHIFTSIYSVTTDNCSAEWRCFSCAGHKLTYLLTYLLTIQYTTGAVLAVDNASSEQLNTRRGRH